MDGQTLSNWFCISFVLDVPLIFVNASSGEVLLTGPVDYETTKSILGFISVNNTVIGVGDLCGGGLTSGKTITDTIMYYIVL